MTYPEWLQHHHREHCASSYQAWFRQETKAGRPPDQGRHFKRRPDWTKATAIDAVQKYVRTHGKLPRSHPTQAYKGCPNPGTAKKLFGGWRKMLTAAGYEYKSQKERRNAA